MSTAGRNTVLGLIRAITPVSEPGAYFRCDADANGGEIPMEDQIHVMRAFDIQTSGLRDGGIANAAAPLWQEDWDVRVNYPASHGVDRERLIRIAHEDARAIVRALLPSVGWQATLSNFHILHDDLTLESVAGVDGAEVALWLHVPVIVEYFGT